MKTTITIKRDMKDTMEFNLGRETRKLADQFEEAFAGKEVDLHIELSGGKK